MATLESQSSIQEKTSLRPVESAQHQGPPHDSQQETSTHSVQQNNGRQEADSLLDSAAKHNGSPHDSQQETSTQSVQQNNGKQEADSELGSLVDPESALRRQEPSLDTQSNQTTSAAERATEDSAASSKAANKKRKRKGKEKEKDNKKPKKRTKKQKKWNKKHIREKMEEWKGKRFKLDKIREIPVVGDPHEFTRISTLSGLALSKKLTEDINTFNAARNTDVRACFLLGQLLQAAFKNRSRKNLLWKDWYEKYIKPACGLSLSYGDQLRKLYRKLHEFPGFQELNIATHHLVRHSSAIREFLDEDVNWHDYWLEDYSSQQAVGNSLSVEKSC